MTEKFTHPNDAPEGHCWTLRNGWEWRFYGTGGSLAIPQLHGAYKNEHGFWISDEWRPSGGYSQNDHPYDLIDAPREHTVWVNVYRSDGDLKIFFYSDRDEANVLAGQGRIACVPVTFTEGEGL